MDLPKITFNVSNPEPRPLPTPSVIISMAHEKSQMKPQVSVAPDNQEQASRIDLIRKLARDAPKIMTSNYDESEAQTSPRDSKDHDSQVKKDSEFALSNKPYSNRNSDSISGSDQFITPPRDPREEKVSPKKFSMRVPPVASSQSGGSFLARVLMLKKNSDPASDDIIPTPNSGPVTMTDTSMQVPGTGIAENITSANNIKSAKYINAPILSSMRGVRGRVQAKRNTVGGTIDTLRTFGSTNRSDSVALESDISLCDNPGSFWGFLRKKSQMKKDKLGSGRLIGGDKNPGRAEKPKRTRLADVINKVKMGVGLGKSLKTSK